MPRGAGRAVSPSWSVVAQRFVCGDGGALVRFRESTAAAAAAYGATSLSHRKIARSCSEPHVSVSAAYWADMSKIGKEQGLSTLGAEILAAE